MNWKIENGILTKEFGWKNFEEAVKFVNNILPLAEEMQHHPDVLIHDYKNVKIMLFTHDEKKVTDKDYTLADKIDNLANSL